MLIPTIEFFVVATCRHNLASKVWHDFADTSWYELLADVGLFMTTVLPVREIAILDDYSVV